MKYMFLCILLIFALPAVSQQEDDLTIARQLIASKQYASAHIILEGAIQRDGLLSPIVTSFVENMIENHFQQRGFTTFYLQNEPASDTADSSIVIASGRHPDRLLRKLLAQKGNSAIAHRLLGDFYSLQLSIDNGSQIVDLSTVLKLKNTIFTHYSKAVTLGSSNTRVNRWLGVYYNDYGQKEIAREYFLKNSKQDDAQSWYYLAQITFREKQYNDAYNYTIRALKQKHKLSLEQHYETNRFAALSLKRIGEEDRFLEYMTRCIHIMPDQQDAYLDLIDFYLDKQDLKRVEQLLNAMLLHNAYNAPGFKALERYCSKSGDFAFADKIFEQLMGICEHSDECMGNIYQYRGNMLYYQGLIDQAKTQWDLSRRYFARILPQDDIKFREIGAISRESSMK
ncbi:MAG: tetratricopeptide repeat protein [Calditrichia bacterium]